MSKETDVSKETEIKTRDVVKEISTRMSCYAKDARELLDHFANLVAEETARGRRVRFTPLGVFYTRQSGRSRADGTRRLLLKFKPSRTLLRKLEEARGTEGRGEDGAS